MAGKTDITIENAIDERSSNTGQGCLRSLQINALRKDMNTPPHSLFLSSRDKAEKVG